MNLKIINLMEIYNCKSPDYVQNLLNAYQCKKDSDIERFLKEKAIISSKRDISKTYLAFDEGKLVGYFTLAMKCLSLPDSELDCSSSFYKRLNPHNGVIQAYLIGQLSRSDNSEKGVGSILLRTAVRMINQIRNEIGCRVVRLDCKDELVPYYEQIGFRKVRKNQDKDLNQMIYILPTNET